MQALMIALGSGTAIGINAVLSKALGEKNSEKVNRSANNGVFLAIICYFIFLLIGIFGIEPFYAAQTKDTRIIEYGNQYLSVICSFSIGVYSQITFERLLQSTGKAFLTMITQGTGAIINIILDPILIFGLFGLPKMGVTGAAIATVIGQCIAAILALFFNIKMNHEVELKVKGFRPDWNIIKQIYSIGIPSIIVQVGGSIMVFGINQILIGFSSTATAVFGLNSGLMPIVAYNYGAGNRDTLPAHHKHQFFVCRILHYYRNYIFRIGQWYLQYDRFHRKTIGSFAACGISAFTAWEGRLCLVGVSDFGHHNSIFDHHIFN